MDSGVSRSNEGGSKDERSSLGELAHRSFCLLRKVGVSAARCDVPTYVHTRVDPRANNCQMKIYLFANTPLTLACTGTLERTLACTAHGECCTFAVAATRETHLPCTRVTNNSVFVQVTSVFVGYYSIDRLDRLPIVDRMYSKKGEI